jgi:magnesium transporter
VAQELGRYNFIALPIVDESDRLVGIVTHDDALDVVQEEATEDAYLQGAVAPLRDTYEETPLPDDSLETRESGCCFCPSSR